MPQQRSLAVLYFQVFVDQLGFGIVLPFLPLYGQTLGASGFEVGLLLAVYSAANTLVSTWWGRLSDRIGRRPVLIAAALGACLGFSIAGAASSLMWLFVGRAVLGTFGVGVQTAQAWIADTTPPEERGKAMAAVGGAAGLGFVAGPVIGGIGLLVGGMRTGFFIAAAFAAGNALFAATVLPKLPPVGVAKQAVKISGWRLILPCLGVVMALVYAFSNIEATFALFTKDELGFEGADNNWLFGVMGVVAALTQVFGTRRLADHLDEVRRVALGLALLAVGAAVMPWATSLWTLVPPVAVIAIGQAIAAPSLVAWVSKRSPPERQGELLGLTQSAGALARVAGPGIGGLVFDHVSHSAPFHIAGGLLALAAIGALIARRA